jgi:TRAP-type C4-dicarboxylate transport system permease small subunit
MKHLNRLLDLIVDLCALLAGLAAVAMMLHVTADVAGRTLFNRPLKGTIEYVSFYDMVALSFLPLGWIARERGHIIVELFTGWMRDGPKRLLDAAVGAVTLVWCAIFAWKALEIALKKTAIHEARETGVGFLQIWPSRYVVVLGFALMALCVARLIVADVRAWRAARG